MQHFSLQQVPIRSYDLFHDGNGSALCESFMLLYERIQGSLRAVLEYNVIMILPFDDLMAFDNVGMIELLMYGDFLFQ